MKPKSILCLIIMFGLLACIAGCNGGSSSGDDSSGNTEYNLFSSLDSTVVYLMDNDGNFVHSWNTDYTPGNASYFLENGELLHTGNVGNTFFDAGGAGGIVQTLDWDANVTWEYEYSSNTYLQHHDVEMLPNGNVLMVAWQYKTESQAIAAGRDTFLLPDGELWPDSVIEVAPTGTNTGTIVWEWHIWDHLVQDHDAEKANYGVVADHPELIDLNYVLRDGGADWTHINAVDYDEELDQILLTVHNFSEVWIIDHSTTTVEAASHSGGNRGKGGDLLYRWGNPQAYGAGTADDQQLFVPHDAQWIGSGYPGEGNILIFNNGTQRPEGDYSSVDEIEPPVTPDGSYTLPSGSAYGPDAPSWCYTADNPTDFYAQNISGAQRLSNGNTLICDGPDAYFFEVDISGTTVWEYTATGQIFRVERYASDFAGFDGTPLDDDTSGQAPVADAGGPYTGDAGTAITLDGMDSYDLDGWISSYAWDLDNDGEYDDADGATADFTASSAGTYTVGLQVMDNEGVTDADTTTVTVSSGAAGTLTYPVVDTSQCAYYDDAAEISAPSQGEAFYGQDARYDGNQASYTVSADGLTVYDNITELTWTRSPDWDEDGDIDTDDKFYFSDFLSYVDTLNAQSYGGYSDWRVPTIKELYSLIDFRGTDPDLMSSSVAFLIPFIDTDYFEFGYGDTDAGERVIDAQFWSGTEYVSTTMNGFDTTFGVNFADGRIKGYGRGDSIMGEIVTQYARFVRGNTDYGINDFVDNGDGTVTDNATGLMWAQDDSGFGMNWKDALAWVQQKNAEKYLGHEDWRLPNAKELQSIVDYTRSPDTTGSAAIDPLFDVTVITNEAGDLDYPFFWTGTTHVNGRENHSGGFGVYISFGRGLGSMDGTDVVDVHGAGCQRSDPKDGDPEEYPTWGNGPQGDVRRVFNYVRVVRDADTLSD